MTGPTTIDSDFNPGELEARCRDLALALESGGHATVAELEAVTPGGAQNPDRGWWGWVRYFARLQVFHDRQEGRAALPDAIADDTRASAALLGTPKRVRLIGRPSSQPAEEAALEAPEPREVWVYPKSYLALVECHVRGVRLGWLAERIYALGEPTEVGDVELLDRALKELTYQQRILAWIATTPGPGLPFPEYGTAPPVPPAAFDDWDGWDHLAVLQGFQSVNSLKQPALDRMMHGIPKEDGGGALNGWSVFFGSLANESGDDVIRIMRDRPLVSLMAGVRLAGGARAAAMDSARTRRDEDAA